MNGSNSNILGKQANEVGWHEILEFGVSQSIFGHYMVTTRSLQGHYAFEFSFMNGSSFEPMLGSFRFRSHCAVYSRGCVPDSVS